MDSEPLPLIRWLTQPPSAFDIVAGRYPESKPKGAIRLRPCLVLDVLRGESGAIACRIAYGTKNTKFVQRRNLDLIIQNATDLDLMGLTMATRFDLDTENIVVLPWTEEFFGCWTGYRHPKIGTLMESYVKDFLFSMALREVNKRHLTTPYPRDVTGAV